MERVIGANIAADSLSSREKFRLLKDEGEGGDLAINENNYYLWGVSVRLIPGQGAPMGSL
jgi:hypothetical protein